MLTESKNFQSIVNGDKGLKDRCSFNASKRITVKIAVYVLRFEPWNLYSKTDALPITKTIVKINRCNFEVEKSNEFKLLR